MMAKNSPVATSSANIVIPRPKSAYTIGTRRVDDSHQWWMQEYHKHQQQQRKQQQSQIQYNKSSQAISLGTANTRDTTSSNNNNNNSGSKKLKGTNLFLNFSSLKINPYDHNFNKKTLHSGTAMKSEQPEPMDGYRIYKGSGYLALGLSRQNTTCVDFSSNGENKPESHDNQVIAPYTPLVLPDKFVLAADKSCSYDNSGSQVDQHPQHHQHKHQQQTTSKQIAVPFHIHLHSQRRTRPHSANSDSYHQHSPVVNSKVKKGVKAKHSVKKVKPSQQSVYRAPTITTIQLQSPEAISLTPRQHGPNLTLPQRTMDQSVHSKSEQCYQHPKSILKNNKPEVIISPSQYLQLGIGNHHRTLPLSYQKLKQEFDYHELLVGSHGKNHHTSPGTVSRHVSLGQGQSAHRVAPAVIASKRPKSAAATTTSRYELLGRSSSPGRKSVTFNSFVSFLSENKISTIRSLPVDV